jgi:hypothetical protein
VAAYKRRQSLQNHTLHANSSKTITNTFQFLSLHKTDQTQKSSRTAWRFNESSNPNQFSYTPKQQIHHQILQSFTKFNITKPLHSSKSLQFHKNTKKSAKSRAKRRFQNHQLSNIEVDFVLVLRDSSKNHHHRTVRTAIQVQIQWIHTITVKEREKKKNRRFSQRFRSNLH